MQSDPGPPESTSPEPASPETATPSAGPVVAGYLHPLALGFDIVRDARRLLVTAIPLLLFGRNSSWWAILIALAMFSLARVLIRYLSFTYRVEGGELVTRAGLIGRTERHIRLERIQEVRIEQGVMHRLFGVVEAKVETGGGGGPEATFTVLARRDAEALRSAVGAQPGRLASTTSGVSSGDSTDSPAAVPSIEPRSEREILRRLSWRDLVLGGLTSNHLVSAFVFLGALWALLDDLLPVSVYQQIDEAIRVAAGRAADEGVRAAVIFAAVSLAVILATGVVLSVLGSIVLFYGFTLARRGADLERSYGLLTRRSSTLPSRRIQTLRIEEGWLRRLAGLAAIRVETVSSRSEDNAEQREGRDLLLPVAPRSSIEGLISAVFPDLEKHEWRRVSPLAVRRGMTKVFVFAALLAGFLTIAFGRWFWLWPLLLVPISYPILRRQYEHLGFAHGERYFRARRGWIGRLVQIVPIRKVQAIEIHQSPFDRRLGLATVVVDTAGQSTTRGGPHVSHLPRAEAEELARGLAQQAAGTEYRV